MANSLDCLGRPLSLETPIIMGVLNVTPDSFSDGGRFRDSQQALEHAALMVEQGAHIIDVGGESTRPGADPVTVDEELRRVIPVIEQLAAILPIPISIDSRKSQVMAEAVRAGAGFINDVGGFGDPEAVAVAVESGACVCIMHMQGQPQTMQQRPHYDDVVNEVIDFFKARADSLIRAGVSRDRIVIDPGFGFGKTVYHNLVLLNRLRSLECLGFPVLVGISRKSMIGKLLNKTVNERLPASLQLALMALERGAAMLRVHDVAETVEMVRLWQSVVDPVARESDEV